MNTHRLFKLAELFESKLEVVAEDEYKSKMKRMLAAILKDTQKANEALLTDDNETAKFLLARMESRLITMIEQE